MTSTSILKLQYGKKCITVIISHINVKQLKHLKWYMHSHDLVNKQLYAKQLYANGKIDSIYV